MDRHNTKFLIAPPSNTTGKGQKCSLGKTVTYKANITVQCEEDHQWQLKGRGEHGRGLSQDSTFNLPGALGKTAVR
jgi:hypothetical protein